MVGEGDGRWEPTTREGGKHFGGRNLKRGA